MAWKHFRFALALVAVGFAWSPSEAAARDGVCSYIIQHPVHGSCYNFAGLTCATCRYNCTQGDNITISNCDT